MSYGIHKKVGGVFQHAKPGLCEACALRRPYGEWVGYCEARGKILSAPPEGRKRGRCDEYESAEDRAADQAERRRHEG